MFCRKTLYSKIEKIHHRNLKVVYGMDDSYKNLLLSRNSVNSSKTPSILSDRDI